MRLQLTPEEQQLYDGLQVEPHDHETWVEVGRRMVPLMRSLAAKGAIPEARARYFLDADFNPGDTRSRRDVFVGNGVPDRQGDLRSPPLPEVPALLRRRAGAAS